MRYILKKSENEPLTLREYRSTPNALYKGFGDIDQKLKSALCLEQGYLCCYCMLRIRPFTTTVEHYVTQNRHTDSPFLEEIHKNSELNYDNMLGSCNTKTRNCSGIRGNIPLSINPKNKLIETQIGYQKDGIIYAINKSESVQKDLETLKLGTFHNPKPTNGEHWLINNRAIVIDNVKANLDRKGWSKMTIQAEIKKWDTPDKDGFLEPYCQVAIFYLEKKLRLYN